MKRIWGTLEESILTQSSIAKRKTA